MKKSLVGNQCMDTIPLDKEGFLKNLDDWSEKIAQSIAEQEAIELSDEHWQIITLTRCFYQRFERSPNMRALVNYLKQSLPEQEKQKASSIYLLKLFPDSPAKRVCKIAGLPKPENCL